MLPLPYQMTLMQHVCGCLLWSAASHRQSLYGSSRCRHTAVSSSHLSFTTTPHVSECRERKNSTKELFLLLSFFIYLFNYLAKCPRLASAVLSYSLMRIHFCFDIIQVGCSLEAFQKLFIFPLWMFCYLFFGGFSLPSLFPISISAIQYNWIVTFNCFSFSFVTCALPCFVKQFLKNSLKVD